MRLKCMHVQEGGEEGGEFVTHIYCTGETLPGLALRYGVIFFSLPPIFSSFFVVALSLACVCSLLRARPRFVETMYVLLYSQF